MAISMPMMSNPSLHKSTNSPESLLLPGGVGTSIDSTIFPFNIIIMDYIERVSRYPRVLGMVIIAKCTPIPKQQSSFTQSTSHQQLRWTVEVLTGSQKRIFANLWSSAISSRYFF